MITEEEKEKYSMYGKQVVNTIVASLQITGGDHEEFLKTISDAFSNQHVIITNLVILLMTNGIDEDTIKQSLQSILYDFLTEKIPTEYQQHTLIEVVAQNLPEIVIDIAKDILTIRAKSSSTFCKYLM